MLLALTFIKVFLGDNIGDAVPIPSYSHHSLIFTINVFVMYLNTDVLSFGVTKNSFNTLLLLKSL